MAGFGVYLMFCHLSHHCVIGFDKHNKNMY